jgi:hypothetical protein
MKGLGVFRWLMPAALAAFLSVPVQTANARGMGGGGGHMGGGGGHVGGGGGHVGGMGGGHMGGRVRMGGTGGLRSHPGMATHFLGRTGASRFGHQNPAFRNHNFDRFAGRTNRFADRGRFGNERFGREGRFEGREGERRERDFFFRHNFFGGFDFGAFGWWPWWGWGDPWWWGWDWDGGGYPGDYGYDPYYGDPQGYASQDNGSQDNGSQYDAEYWNNLAMSVQTKLADQGYYHGQIDGVVGSGTIEAVRKFQTDHRLPRTGKIDPKLLNALSINYKAQS